MADTIARSVFSHKHRRVYKNATDLAIFSEHVATSIQNSGSDVGAAIARSVRRRDGAEANVAWISWSKILRRVNGCMLLERRMHHKANVSIA